MRRRSIIGRGARTFSMRLASHGGDGLRTRHGYEELADLILEAAPHELLLTALGQALARTSRQESTLERRVAPELRARIGAIAAMLSEHEREDQARLRHLRRKK